VNGNLFSGSKGTKFCTLCTLRRYYEHFVDACSSVLDILLLNLDKSEAGSTLSTRRTAAKQIGEIAKARPEDLYALLKKVETKFEHVYLVLLVHILIVIHFTSQ
jgi:hypothetical protein